MANGHGGPRREMKRPFIPKKVEYRVKPYPPLLEVGYSGMEPLSCFMGHGGGGVDVL